MKNTIILFHNSTARIITVAANLTEAVDCQSLVDTLCFRLHVHNVDEGSLHEHCVLLDH